MKYLIDQMRRYAEEALNPKGMHAGLPKVRVDAGQLLGLCDRAEQLLEENERLRCELESIRLRDCERKQLRKKAKEVKQ